MHCTTGSLNPPLTITPSPLPTFPAVTTNCSSPAFTHTPPITAPPLKKFKLSQPSLPTNLGEYISRDASLINSLGWTKFVHQRRPHSDFSSLQIHHPARHLLKHYRDDGAPVRFHSAPWTKQQLQKAIHRGPHSSCHDYLDFLETEFIDMINKGQWIVIPFSMAKHLSNLRLSPPGVVPQRDRRPRWIVDYSWYDVNKDTLPLAPAEAMQFGHALDRFLRELLLADPRQGPTFMIKLDIADGFYRIALSPNDIPKLGVVFPSASSAPKLVALPLVLPMGWKNSPPIFSAATETIADIANNNINNPSYHPSAHPLDPHAARLDHSNPTQPPSSAQLHTSPLSPSRDPCLPSQPSPAAYIDVYVDDFLALAQGASTRSKVRNTLLHAVDSVFRPTTFQDNPNRREPVSIKKLRQGDMSWSTSKQVLGWTIDTVAMTIALPPHRQQRLHDILHSIPPQQKRTSIKKWHKILGELRSMSLALPGSRNLFSILQLALSNSSTTGRISLKKEVHATIKDFKWMLNNISNRPTRIAEIIPLLPSAMGYHDAAGTGAGGVWFPTPELHPCANTQPNQPLVWRTAWPHNITTSLITEANPHGSITNSDLELAGGLLHLDIIAQHFDVRERTILSKTDNLATLFWQRKGSTTTNKAPAHLLRLFGIHQRYHHYVPRHDYIPGPSNPMADDASRLSHLSNSSFLSHFNSKYPQPIPYQLVTPTPSLLSAVISALHRKTCNVESLLAAPPPATPTGPSGPPSLLNWASTPYSKPSKTKYPSFRSSSTEFDMANSQPTRIKSSLDQLKSTYGLLHRRTSPWGPQTHASTLVGM